ncbi:cytoplasmic dynein 1 light intermediate chain 2 [Limosa lapponica baueri]|uniref:Dynein light intermediate chain n=1 Tax=Limosa lapponica baueri TaxID=1758121 RepID=A0A2I0SYT9_LIMLA|nr:cytoplasmic dynein 1 light intermediate chain 2 [Limosa lapponica baueri]
MAIASAFNCSSKLHPVDVCPISSCFEILTIIEKLYLTSFSLMKRQSFPSCCRPAGWDNEKKIAILHENFTTVKPEDAYEDFIVKPPVRKVKRGKFFPAS